MAVNVWIRHGSGTGSEFGAGEARLLLWHRCTSNENSKTLSPADLREAYDYR